MFEHSLGSLFLFPLLKGMCHRERAIFFVPWLESCYHIWYYIFSPCPENFEGWERLSLLDRKTCSYQFSLLRRSVRDRRSFPYMFVIMLLYTSRLLSSVRTCNCHTFIIDKKEDNIIPSFIIHLYCLQSNVQSQREIYIHMIVYLIVLSNTPFLFFFAVPPTFQATYSSVQYNKIIIREPVSRVSRSKIK